MPLGSSVGWFGCTRTDMRRRGLVRALLERALDAGRACLHLEDAEGRVAGVGTAVRVVARRALALLNRAVEDGRAFRDDRCVAREARFSFRVQEQLGNVAAVRRAFEARHAASRVFYGAPVTLQRVNQEQ